METVSATEQEYTSESKINISTCEISCLKATKVGIFSEGGKIREKIKYCFGFLNAKNATVSVNFSHCCKLKHVVKVHYHQKRCASTPPANTRKFFIETADLQSFIFYSVFKPLLVGNYVVGKDAN